MLGYDVPEVREAVERQLASGVVHTSTLYLIRSQVELAEKLARLSGIENAKVFFTNSGTEANETALMLATAARGQTGCWRCAQLSRPLVRRGRDHRQRGLEEFPAGPVRRPLLARHGP
jgi:4-aminobutyrate aminotransferase-like enzyme